MTAVRIKLFKMAGSARYFIGVISRLGESTFNVHDRAGVPHFMRIRPGETAIDLTEGAIPTNDGMVLAVDSLLKATVRNCGSDRPTFDHRLGVTWLDPSKLGDKVPLDGSYVDSRGRRYFASTREATRWILEYLGPVVSASEKYVAMVERQREAEKASQGNRRAMLYAAANGDNYGPEYAEPVLTSNGVN